MPADGRLRPGADPGLPGGFGGSTRRSRPGAAIRTTRRSIRAVPRARDRHVSRRRGRRDCRIRLCGDPGGTRILPPRRPHVRTSARPHGRRRGCRRRRVPRTDARICCNLDAHGGRRPAPGVRRGRSTRVVRPSERLVRADAKAATGRSRGSGRPAAALSSRARHGRDAGRGPAGVVAGGEWPGRVAGRPAAARPRAGPRSTAPRPPAPRSAPRAGPNPGRGA